MLNLAAVRKDGAAPVFGTWKTGEATLDTLPSGWTVIDATDSPYSVVADDSTNAWSGITSAAAAAAAAGGGVVQLPTGTIRAYPTDGDVTLTSGKLHMDPGDTAATAFLDGSLSNVVVQGYIDGQGEPLTTLNMRLWHDEPGTNYLNELNTPSGDPNDDADIDNIRRYRFWNVADNVQNIQLRRLKIDGTAVPVNTGKEWQTLEGKRNQWDTSHKVLGANDVDTRNWLVEDVECLNWRAEMIYSGGLQVEKIKLVRANLRQANSSITSFSADSEYDGCTFSDAANALIENLCDRINDLESNQIAYGLLP